MIVAISKISMEGCDPEYREELHRVCVRQSKNHIYLEESDHVRLKSTHRPLVGTELKRLISWLPVTGKNKCGRCYSLERKFNSWGVERCEKNIERMVRYLRIAARRRKIPASDFLLRVLVNRAIRNMRQ